MNTERTKYLPGIFTELIRLSEQDLWLGQAIIISAGELDLFDIEDDKLLKLLKEIK
jgi:hypothetical protein